MRQNASIWTYLLAAIGFIVIFSIVATFFSALLFLLIKILIPIALVVWLIQFISKNINTRR